MTKEELKLVGFHWIEETSALLPNGSVVRIEPTAYRASGEKDAQSEHARKLLRLYKVTMSETKELTVIELEKLMGSPTKQAPK